MARPLRIEFPGAIYHAMSRGNARQEASRGQAWFSVFTTTADTMRQSASGC